MVLAVLLLRVKLRLWLLYCAIVHKEDLHLQQSLLQVQQRQLDASRDNRFGEDGHGFGVQPGDIHPAVADHVDAVLCA